MSGTWTGGSKASTEEEVSQCCGVILSQHNEAYINPNWVLLNSESTDHIFCNKKKLTDIELRTDGKCLRLYYSRGHLDTQQKGKFGGLKVCYNPKSLVKFLSLGLVTEQHRVTLESEDENAFLVHITAENVIKCIRGPLPCLYYFNAGNIHMTKIKLAFSFLNIVTKNKKLFKI